jgi:hypothetical protein
MPVGGPNQRMKYAALIAVAASACDPLVDDAYTGQSLFTLEGTLAETMRPHAADAGFALLWQDPGTAAGPGIDATVLPFALDALSSFIAQIPAKPPAGAWFAFDDGGPRLGEAYLHVVSHVPVTSPGFDLGMDPVHVVVYVDGDVAGGAASDYLGGDLTAGYHLRRFAATGEPGAAQRELIARCAANTGDRDACAVRRAYRLDPIADETALRILLRVE